MKKVMLRAVMPVFLGVTMLASCGNAQQSDEKMAKAEFKVYGNCGMCEKTIEGSLNGKDGIGEADWDKDTKMITVSYDAEKMDENKIKEMIAGVGYDSDSHRAKKSTYSKLPGCCQYTRPE